MHVYVRLRHLLVVLLLAFLSLGHFGGERRSIFTPLFPSASEFSTETIEINITKHIKI